MNFRIFRKIIAVLLLIVFAVACEQTESSELTDNNSETEVKAEKKALRTIPVEAIIAKIESVEQKIPLSGITQPLSSVDLISEVSGKVEIINKKLGEYVSIKDTLAIIDDRVPKSQFLQAKSQLLSANNNLMIAELNLKSDKELFESGDISKLAYENSILSVKTAEANKLSAEATLNSLQKGYYDTRITSPINGIISRKNIELGTMVSTGMSVYRVVDLKTIKVTVGVSQDVISHVEIGDKAEVTISALNNAVYEGKVKFISPQADESTGGFNVEIHVVNDKNIKAGMTAKVDLVLKSETEVVVVPEYAMVSKNNKDYIYKVKNGVAELTNVEIKEIIGSHVLLKNSIAVGDTIVTVGKKNLGTKTKVFIEAIN